MDEVELFLDSLHSIRNYGINKYKRPIKLNPRDEADRAKDRATYLRKHVNELWDTTVIKQKKKRKSKEEYVNMEKPEENLIYFTERDVRFVLFNLSTQCLRASLHQHYQEVMNCCRFLKGLQGKLQIIQ